MWESSLFHFLTLIYMSTLMEESYKAGDVGLRQAVILVGVLPSLKERRTGDRKIRTKPLELLLGRLPGRLPEF